MSNSRGVLPAIGTLLGAAIGGGTTFGTGTAAGAALGASIGGAAGGGIEAATYRPKLPIPAVVPMPDQSQIDKAKQDSLMSQFARRGRASTVLTGAGQDTGKLGG